MNSPSRPQPVQLAYRIMGIAARLLLALGAVCLLLGVYLSSKTLEFTQGAQSATGTVVRYFEAKENGRDVYRPMVRFSTPEGNIYSISGQLASGSKRFAIGAPVPVQYPPGEPRKARLATFTDNWLGPTIAGGVGALALLAGVFVRRAVRREVARSGA